MPAGLSKMILAQHFCTVAREECNKYDLTDCCLSRYDWPIVMIGPSGLLFISSLPFICSRRFCFSGRVAKKRKKERLNLNTRFFFFARSHAEHHWG